MWFLNGTILFSNMKLGSHCNYYKGFRPRLKIRLESKSQKKIFLKKAGTQLFLALNLKLTERLNLWEFFKNIGLQNLN